MQKHKQVDTQILGIQQAEPLLDFFSVELFLII